MTGTTVVPVGMGPRDTHLASIISRLAVNYRRNFAADEDFVALMSEWRKVFARYEVIDLDRAVEAVIADPAVRFFPTAGELRSRVVDAMHARKRGETAAAPVCAKCEGSGWLDAGHDDEHRWYVDRCPNGCLPPTEADRRKAEGRARRGQMELVDDPARAQAMVRALAAKLKSGELAATEARRRAGTPPPDEGLSPLASMVHRAETADPLDSEF